MKNEIMKNLKKIIGKFVTDLYVT